MIEIDGLTKKFGDKVAVDNVTFRVDEGEIVGFLGPNGAGKSTTMNIITGYLSATDGTAKIDGIEILENPKAAKSKIGFLPEQPPLYMDMTVKEYLNFVYNLKGCKLPRREHIKKICDTVKITDVYHRIIKNLSKGYKQRVGIAQALIGNPKVLIFDEPTVGLDPKQIIDIRNLIRDLGRSHTVILSTHILPEVQAVCDRIVIINKGQIVANERTEELAERTAGMKKYRAKICGPSAEVLKKLKECAGVLHAELTGERDADAEVYVIDADVTIEARKPLFNMLAENGWPLVGLENDNLSLEDIFIKFTSEKKKGAAN